MAGESARATARTRRAKAEQLLRSADAFERGAEGEETTARVLGILSSDDWRIFHDVRWPGRVHANIDHVLVGPSGVFVIDSKAWAGSIEVRGGALRQDGRRRHRYVIAAAAAAMAIGELLPEIEPKVIHPVICFVRPQPIFGWSGDTMICSTENVVTFLTSLPRVLDTQQMSEAAEALATSLDIASAALAPASATHSGLGPADATTRRAPGRRERRLRLGVPRRFRVAARLGVIAVAVALAFQLDLPARVGDLAVNAEHLVLAPTEPIGSTVAVHGLLSRPSLEVTAGTPVVTRSEVAGVRPTRGQQLVAVPVSVQNTGIQDWSSHGDVSAVLTDGTGATYSNDPAYATVSAGPALRSTITLPPGERTSGLVVFEVPRDTRVRAVQLRVGPSLPTTLRWSVD